MADEAAAAPASYSWSGTPEAYNGNERVQYEEKLQGVDQLASPWWVNVITVRGCTALQK
jgi:hypothetical protein